MAAGLTVGDFSRATHLSVKTLRHYHQVGLLEPATVNPDTGYRYYSAGQIPTAQVIRRLRDLEMPVADVKAVLAAPDAPARNALIAAHLGRLETELAQTRAAVESLRTLLAPPDGPVAVEHRSVPATAAAAITAVLDREDILAWWQGALGELRATVRAQGLHATGPPGGVFAGELFQADRGQATVFTPVGGRVRPIGRVTPMMIPAAELAIICHHGSLADADLSYARLGSYVTAHEISIDGPLYEYYLRGAGDTPDEAEWRTEIGWPIFRADARPTHVRSLAEVPGRGRGAGAPGRGLPAQDAWARLFQFPSLALLTPMMVSAQRLLVCIITHMTIGDAIRAATDAVRCLIYVRISLDDKHDEHGVANQMAKLEQRAAERGWTVVYRLSDNDIGVTRKDPTRPGKYRPGYEEAMRLVDARMVDAVLCFKWDRFIREPLDLEYLIPRFDRAGVRFAEVDGSIDLGTDSGRLHARIMIAVAKAEQERKAERQKLAFEQAAINGKRFTGCPRPFGYQDDHVTAHPVEGPAVAEACAALLGGGTISGIRREWTRLGLNPPQKARRGTTTWNRTSIRMILLNPRIAGLSAYHGEIVGQGDWEPLVPEETWRAVRGILDDPTRKPPRGVRTLLGGLALCPCGNVVTGMPSHTGHHIYRCTPATRNRSYPGAHVARQAGPVEEFIGKLVVARLSRPDAAGLVAVEDSGVDVAALREEAAAIRANLAEMAADRALGKITRAQMLRATEAGTARLEAIGAELESAARENVLAPLVAAENAAAMWSGLDISRKRAVITTLMTATVHSPGRGARRPFDPATVTVTWRQPDAA